MFSGNKKGWEHGVVVTLLVVLASTVVLLFVYTYFWRGISEAGKDLVCEKNIRLAAESTQYPSLSSPLGVGKPYFSIAKACPRNKIVFAYDDIVEDGLINQEKAHKILTDHAYRCWKKVGEGKIDPFSRWGNDGESYCLICGVVSFDSKLRKFMAKYAREEGFGITSPAYYLMTHEAPDPKLKGKSYWEYFYNQKPQLTEDEVKKLQEDKQRVQEGLAIVVTVYKPTAKSEFWTQAGQYGGLAAVVVGAGTLVIGGLALVPILVGGTILVGGGFVSYSSFTSAFSDCKECRGIGGLSFLFSEEAFKKEYSVTIGGTTQMVKICTRPVN